MDNLDRSFNIDLSERFEMLTRPKDLFKLKVLYHISTEKSNIVEPKYLNYGTKLSHPRMSSFWFDNREACIGYAAWQSINMAFFNFKSIEEYNAKINSIPRSKALMRKYSDSIADLGDCSIYVNENTDINLDLIKNVKFYLYSASIKGFHLGIGHVNQNEYTYDKPINPDTIEEITYKDIMPHIKSVNENDFRKYKEIEKENQNRKKQHLGDFPFYKDAVSRSNELYKSNIKERDTMKLSEEYQLFESRLPQDGSDPEFGLPDKKKFPLYDEAHVKSAIKFFNYAQGEDKIKLAKAIKAKMNKYGISYDTVGDDNNLKQYLTEFYNFILEAYGRDTSVDHRTGRHRSKKEQYRVDQYYDKLDAEEKRKQEEEQENKLHKKLEAEDYEKEQEEKKALEDKKKRDKYYLDDEASKAIYHEPLAESVLDPINKERCKDLFKNDKLIPTARKFILDIIADFKRQVNFPFEVRNIYMIGSSTGFQYSATSDIDIEVETTIPKSKLYQIIKIIPKGTLLPNTQKPINLFIVTDGDEYNFDQAENVYDIKGNKWLKQTEKSNHNIPYQYIKDLSQFFMNGCDLTLSKFNQDKKEIQEYMGLDPKVQEISEKEKAEAIDRKINDIKNDIDAITMAHHVIFSFEKEGYNNMPFKLRIDMEKNDDPRYSVNNLVYKMIDRFGYLDKLNEAKKDAINIVKEAEKHVD